jgi:acyl carrier protein
VTRDEIRNVVIRTLTAVAPEVDPSTLDPAEDLRDQVDLDSMDFLNLVIALSEELGVEVPESDYPKLATLDGMVAYVAAAVGTPED